MTQAAPSSLWVHVSTLMAWDRPPVGIVRVEREYCRWLLRTQRHASDPRIRFCVYDRERGEFQEVSRAQVHERIHPRPPGPPDPLPPAPLTLRRMVKLALRAPLALLPHEWEVAIRVRARQMYHQLRRRLGLDREPAVRPEPRVPFAPGDRFVSMGLDWEYLDLPVLFRLKQRLALRVTLVCYDAIPILYPQLAGLAQGVFTAYFADMAWCADHLLCISERTRRDCRAVLQDLGAPVPPMQLLRLGADPRPDGMEERPPGLGGDDRPFVLFVSTIERRKNHEALYRAWVRLREQGITPHRLVFVGMPAWGVADLMHDLKSDPRVRGDIVCLDRVTDAQLHWLYRHADFTAFPSLYEGWGLPVVESLAWGKFCLASNAASIPEAGGAWAEYLDPWDLPAWVQRLAYYMAHPDEVAQRNQRIALEFKAPTWAATSQAIHDAALAAGQGAEG